jgi:SPP1 family predicted phage head-tail adaptor
MRAGRMSERCTLLRKSASRDALGGEVITWVEDREVWAQVTPVSGREYFASLQVVAESAVTFRMHYEDASDVTDEWRITWRAQQYDILNVGDLEARRRTIELIARTAPN